MDLTLKAILLSLIDSIDPGLILFISLHSFCPSFSSAWKLSIDPEEMIEEYK